MNDIPANDEYNYENAENMRFVEELTGTDELKNARWEAERDAFQFVSQKIGTSSNLESLEQVKQSVLSKHQNKIAFLKAQVQGIVSNIETGISNLYETSSDLQTLKSEINIIEEESSNAIVVDNFKSMQSLATLWERVNIIDDLMYNFKSADDMINDIVKFFEDNPHMFSIKLFTTIESLIDFENDLLKHVDDVSLKKFVEDHFQPVHNSRSTLINNVHECLENAFTQSADQLIRANWIMCAINEHDRIIEYLRSAITRQAYSKMEDVDKNNVALYLQTLSSVIETLPEQLDLLIPALPSDINALELTTSYANTEIYKMLVNYKDTMPMNAALVDAMIKCMKDIECTLRALLGVSPSEDFYNLLFELQSKFENILYTDYNKFLENIIKLDIDSISQKRDGTFYTPGPKDLIDRLLDAYNFAKCSASNLAPSARPKLIDQLAEAFVNLGNSACDSWNQRYIMAICNDSVDAVKQISDFAKSNPEIVLKEDIKKLQKPWSETKNRGLATLAEIALSRIFTEDDEFRDNFNEKLDLISENMTDLSKHLFQPLYKKLVSVIIRDIVPHYIQSYFRKEWANKPKTQEDFESMVTSECNGLSSLFKNLEPNLCRSSIEAIEAFRDLMIEDYDALHDIFHIIAKEYNDFTPYFALGLIRVRVDFKDQKRDVYDQCKEAFEMMYTNIPQDRGDHFFNPDLVPKKGLF